METTNTSRTRSQQRQTILPLLLAVAFSLSGCPDEHPQQKKRSVNTASKPLEKKTPKEKQAEPGPKTAPDQAASDKGEKTPAPVTPQEGQRTKGKPARKKARPKWQPAKTIGEAAQGHLRLKQGTVLRFSPAHAIGLVEVVRQERVGGGVLTAHINVATGQHSFQTELPSSGRLRVGDAELVLVKVVETHVDLRWTKPYRAPQNQQQALEAVAGNKRLELKEMGFYQLPDGAVIGVGNVFASIENKLPALRVHLSIFPPKYQQDPTQSWDLHRHAKKGQRLKGEVRSYLLDKLVQASKTAPGSIELQP